MKFQHFLDHAFAGKVIKIGDRSPFGPLTGAILRLGHYSAEVEFMAGDWGTKCGIEDEFHLLTDEAAAVFVAEQEEKRQQDEAQAEVWQARIDAELERIEREQYARLKAKYEGAQ